MITQEYFGVLYKVVGDGGCPFCYFVDKEIDPQIGVKVRDRVFCHMHCKIDHFKFHWEKYEDCFDWGFAFWC